MRGHGTTDDVLGTESRVDLVERAIEAFRNGEPVLIYDFDDREGETDIVYPAEAITPAAVARLRNDAGGLVCVALAYDVAEAFDLPFIGDVLDHPSTENPDLAYDARSSFSLTVNHRDTFTGITDDDRALTITKLAEAAREAQRVLEDRRSETASRDLDGTDFAAEFRAPGHVHLLKAAEHLLDDRRGQTELGIAIAEAAGTDPAVVVCEMLSDETGGALSVADAKAYAERHGLVFVDGDQLVDGL